jgi:hypothetical protein
LEDDPRGYFLKFSPNFVKFGKDYGNGSCSKLIMIDTKCIITQVNPVNSELVAYDGDFIQAFIPLLLTERET